MDGNKRVALASALVFLELNNFCFIYPEEQLYDIVMGVAKSEVTKETLVDIFEKYSIKRK
jgi:death-on-curing protein